MGEEGQHTSVRSPPRSIDKASALEALITEARHSLSEIFDDLAATHERGRSARRTPPRHGHRLMELIDSVSRSARRFESAQPAIDVVSIAELHLTVDLLRQARGRPGWLANLRAMRNPTTFPHEVVKLAAERYLTALGNPVQVPGDQGSGERSPDLLIIVGQNESMAVEVKAPTALQSASGTLQRDDALEIVRRQLRSAGTGARGQLSPQRPGILVIGGFHLRKADLELLKELAVELLPRAPGGRKHIAGVVVLSVGLLAENIVFEPDRIVSSSETLLHPIIQVRVAKNPSYAAALPIEVIDEPDLRGEVRKVHGDTKEIALPPADVDCPM